MALIEREALLAAYDAAHKGPPGGARKLIAEAPEVDAVPVKHGKWIYHDDDIMPWISCDQCGISTDALNKTPYCPFCGAEMDGGKDDGNRQ